MMEKKATIEELKGFFEHRQGVTISRICKEAGVSYRVWYYLLNSDPPKRGLRGFSPYCEKIMREKLRPVMAKYGHTY
jgi:hypothetical protein